mgnify:CR=1 FL=1
MWNPKPMVETPISEARIRTDDDLQLPEPPRWMLYAPDVADRLFASESFRQPSRSRRRPVADPFSREWFEQIERQRYSRPGHWIPRVLEFGRHAGETLLGLGDGLGTDWLQYARHGARVIVCSRSPEQIDLIERNFRLRDCPGRFMLAPTRALPIDSASIDVVCIQGHVGFGADAGATIDEIYRVLRPGGKVIVVTRARYDAGYWHDRVFPWRRWWRRTQPPCDAATARELRRDFGRFVDHVVKKRHLRRAQLPQLWRLFPLPVLERFLGQYLILKAFKPVTAAFDLPAAA